jgi:hypothetical protein
MTTENNNPNKILSAEAEMLERLQASDKRVSAPNAPSFRTLADDLSEGSNMAVYMAISEVAHTIRPDAPVKKPSQKTKLKS